MNATVTVRTAIRPNKNFLTLLSPGTGFSPYWRSTGDNRGLRSPLHSGRRRGCAHGRSRRWLSESSRYAFVRRELTRRTPSIIGVNSVESATGAIGGASRITQSKCATASARICRMRATSAPIGSRSGRPAGTSVNDRRQREAGTFCSSGALSVSVSPRCSGRRVIS